MKDYLKNETISLCRNQYEIQICIPACKMNSEFFSNYLSLLFNFTQKSTNNAKNEYSQISHGIVLQKTGLTSFNPAQTCKCQKRERVQTYAKDTTRKMKTDLKLCDTDGDGENPRQKKKYNPRKGTEQSSPLVLLKSVETSHGRNKMFSVC